MESHQEFERFRLYSHLIAPNNQCMRCFNLCETAADGVGHPEWFRLQSYGTPARQQPSRGLFYRDRAAGRKYEYKSPAQRFQQIPEPLQDGAPGDRKQDLRMIETQTRAASGCRNEGGPERRIDSRIQETCCVFAREDSRGRQLRAPISSRSSKLSIIRSAPARWSSRAEHVVGIPHATAPAALAA